jgi:hypothetical protein
MLRIITATLILIFAAAWAQAKEVKSFDLTTEIGTDNLDGLISMLEKAEQGDVINVKIDSPGGSVVTTMKVVDAMSNTKAKVSCVVDKLAASGAAVIMLQCDDVKLVDKALVLFHLPFYVVHSVPLLEQHMVHDGLYSEQFVNMMNSRFCFRDSITPIVYEKFLMGQDIFFETVAAQQILDKTCRVKHGMVVVGHK